MQLNKKAHNDTNELESRSNFISHLKKGENITQEKGGLCCNS